MVESRTMWLSWLTFLTGLWLVISPFVLGYSDIGNATTNDIIVGVVVAILALVTAVWSRSTAGWLSWIIAIVGIWEVAAPFILGYSQTATPMWNAVILGILIFIFTGARALTFQAPAERREYGPTFPSEERPKKEADD